MKKTVTAINNPVIVLNRDYSPVNICKARQAVVMINNGKAEVIANGQGDLHSINQTFPLPFGFACKLLPWIGWPNSNKTWAEKGAK